MGGASAPMLSARIAAIWDKSIGAEAPPTKANRRDRRGDGRAGSRAGPSRPAS
ncbi:DUF6053 domain-containing protein [Lysobacter enzymogenes]|uniref:DUF6053 domain-containing protein n=1 Tax=Lysobacter enzymogenes TaxID=69 RepID=UPI0037478848